VAKKATAAERAMVITTSTKHPTAVDCQRDEFLAMWSDPRPDQPADEADDATLAFHSDLDRLLAAARAEAVAPLEARVAELESERGALVEADILRRARVGEVLDVLRQLVEAMPRCTAGGCGSAACDGCEVTCGLTATRGVVCDEHGDGELDSDYAAPLRLALALLAADKAGAKAGKP
jgi:hypothetical protein